MYAPAVLFLLGSFCCLFSHLAYVISLNFFSLFHLVKKSIFKEIVFMFRPVDTNLFYSLLCNDS